MTNPFAPQPPAGGQPPFGPPQQAPPQQPPPQAPPQQGWGQQQAPPQQGGWGQQAPPQQPPAQPPRPPQQPPAQRPQQTRRDEFDQPAQGFGDAITQDDWQSWIGTLILFEVQELRTGLVTKNTAPGETTTAVMADVHVIDVTNGPILKENAAVFPPALVTALRKTATSGGGRVLGRLAVLVTQAGRNTVQLAEYTDADANTARQYLAWRASQSMQQPAQAPPPQQEQPPF